MKLLKTTLLSSALLVGTVSANEVTLPDVVSFMVKKAVVETSYDIANDVYASVLNASYQFELIESPIKTQVLISQTDVKSEDNTEKAE